MIEHCMQPFRNRHHNKTKQDKNSAMRCRELHKLFKGILTNKEIMEANDKYDDPPYWK